MRQKSFLLPAVVACLVGCMSNIANAQTTVTFQTGQNGYTGLFDLFIGRHATTLGSGTTNVQGSSVTNFFLDGRYNTSDDTQGLFRFDNIFGAGAGQIATGSRILSASLEFTTPDEITVPFANSAGPYAVGQLLQSFDATTTYNGVTEGYRFFSGETGRWLSNGFGNSIVPASPTSANVKQIVQNWANGNANNGFVVNSATENGWAIYTSGVVNKSLSPKLTVTFDTSSVPPSTQSTFIQSAANASNSMFLVDNIGNAYLNADTSSLNNGNGNFPEANFLTPAAANFAGAAGQEALIRYNNIFQSEGGLIPIDAIIDSAVLLVNTPMYHVSNAGVITGASQNYESNSTFSIRQVLTDWNGNSGTPSSLTFGSPVSGQFSMIPDSEAEFDVTSILQNWQGGAGNFGFNLYGSNGTNGWGILNSQAGAGAPRLVVNWRVAAIPEPGSLVLLSGLGLLLSLRRQR